jgi:hypothetical protein
MNIELNKRLKKWKRDPMAFIRDVLINPDTGTPFELSLAQRRFLRRALTVTAEGRLRFPELLFSAPKKSGKTTLAAMTTIYLITCLGGSYAEAYWVANDLEQATSRVFQAVVRIIEQSPLLRGSAKITANKIEFASTGATITALASDYAGAAGANPTITVFDELWGYTSERAQRLWDEMVPVPTRKVSVRLTVTYAGFEGESALLESLYKRGLQGEEVEPRLYEQPGLLMFWSHEPIADWQSPEWIEQMRGQLRRNAFLRMIENRWVTSESTFVDMEWWDACVDVEARPLLTDPHLSVWVGVDASTKRDSTAIVACTFNSGEKKVRLVWHRIFQPSPEDPLDFESTVEKYLLELKRRFWVREVRFDPYQMQATAQRLSAAGIPMVEFPQTISNLTEAPCNKDSSRSSSIMHFKPTPSGFSPMRRDGPHGCERAADPADCMEVASKMMPARIWKTNSRASSGGERPTDGPLRLKKGEAESSDADFRRACLGYQPLVGSCRAFSLVRQLPIGKYRTRNRLHRKAAPCSALQSEASF